MKSLFKILFAFLSIFCLTGLVIANIPTQWFVPIAQTFHVSVDTLTHFVTWFGGASGLSIASGYYPASCDAEIPTHACDPCEDREFGRLRSAGFIHKDFEFANGDTENPEEWKRGMESKQIIVIPDTNGEMPEPSEKVGAGYGDTVETLLGYDFTAKFNDPNFASNCDFYNAIVGNRNYKFFFRTSSKTYITPVTVTIIPKFSVANDMNAEVTWNVLVKWISNQFPCPFNTPEGIFNACFIPE